MPESTVDHADLDRALGRTRLWVLVTLALCAAVTLSTGAAQEEPVERSTTFAAMAVAIGSIAMRRLSTRPSTPPRTAVWLAIAGMLLALGVGALGTMLAISQSARETGLLFALGGFILALPRAKITPSSETPR